MLLKDLKYRQTFSSIVKPIVSEEKDKFLALASLQELSRFIPDIDISKDIDLLPIAFNACVINRINKNGDIINTEQALATYKRFIRKFVDTEHNRQKVVGVILSASFSEFGTDKLLTEDDVRGKFFPFNITLGAIIWKAINNDLCELIEDSNDPTSANYMEVSASWELGFSDYRIIELPLGEKNLVNPQNVPEEEKENIKKYLKCFGGSGVKDGKCYYRMPCQDLIPMGIGLTEKPAADVAGIATHVTPNQDVLQTQAVLKQADAKDANQENEKIIVQSEKIGVIPNRLENINMKINSITDITDENLKQCSASVIADFISAEIQKASDEFAKASTEKSNQHAVLQQQHTELAKSVSEMRGTIENLTKEREEREHVDRFNRHMNEVHADYDMPSDVASVVTEQVKSCASDEIFAKWKSAAGVLLKPYNRKEKEVAAKAMTDGPTDGKDGKSTKKSSTTSGPDDDKETKAAQTDGPKDGGKDEDTKKKSSTVSGPDDDDKSSKKAKAAIASAVEDALDNGTVEKAAIANTSSAATPKLKEKYAQAFAEQNFIVN